MLIKQGELGQATERGLFVAMGWPFKLLRSSCHGTPSTSHKTGLTSSLLWIILRTFNLCFAIPPQRCKRPQHT
jgi:hypothetical protein